LQQTKQKWIRDYGLPAIITRKRVKKLWPHSHPGPPRQPFGRLKAWWRYLRWIDITNLRAEMTGSDARSDQDGGICGVGAAQPLGRSGCRVCGNEPRINGAEFCNMYNLLGFWCHRVYRIILPLLLFLVLSVALSCQFDTSFTPSRGFWSSTVERIAVCGSFILQTILIFFVVDASR